MGGQAGDVPALEQDAAGRRAMQAGDGAEEGGLAGAVGADDGDGLAGVEPQADVGQRLQLAMPDGQPGNFEDGPGGGRAQGEAAPPAASPTP
jgi:hypothetical protein